MYYISQTTILNAFNALKNQIPSKFIGLLSILRSLDTDGIRTNNTYKVRDELIGNWLNDVMSLEDLPDVESDSVFYVRFAVGWDDYVAENMFSATPNIVPLLVFIYKEDAFSEKPSVNDLFVRFVSDFHISTENVNKWFDKTLFNIEYSTSLTTKSSLKVLLGYSNNTLTFDGAYSVKAKASELSRAPFIQTLYAGMDSLRCLLISRTDLEEIYPSSIDVPTDIPTDKKQEGNTPVALPSRQIIYYGAPGTGKSYKIQEITETTENFTRTTFHPDSDYSTFVGCYKPSMESTDEYYERLCDINYLAQLLKSEYYESDKKTVVVDSFAVKYAEYLDGIYGKVSLNDLCEKAEIPTGYATKIRDDINLYHSYVKNVAKPSKIAYSFVPQAFLQAYVKAWKNQDEPYYLVIEEINRGNCAQIFGDLFQLLDRDKSGKSTYGITPDKDIANYLKKEFAHTDNLPEKIKSATMMMLPSNLYILCSMNTSDQSLFPIDSAFKRRWDSEYVPIEDAGKKHYIKIGNLNYDWWNFIETINGKIDALTGSEDKKMGYWFVKPQNDDKVITAKQFVSKVMFYLWNDIFKDYYGNSQCIFKIKNADGTIEKKPFTYFFGSDAENRIKAFMAYNKIEPISVDDIQIISDDTPD